MLCSKFSKQALNSDQALNSIGITNYKSIPSIPIESIFFPECTSISNDILQQEVDKVIINLQDLNTVMNMKIVSMYTMKEYISTILIGVLQTIIRSNHEKYSNKNLTIVCNKDIIGKSAYGIVDYSIIYDCMDLIVTESKNDNLNTSIVQNLLQQRACQDFLTNTLIDYNTIQSERKRKFYETFDDIVLTPTYGITTTGSQWVLSKIVCNRRQDTGEIQSRVYISDTIEINLSNIDTIQLKRLMSRVAHLIIQYTNAITLNNNLNKRRKAVFSYESTASIALQDLQYERIKSIKSILSHKESEETIAAAEDEENDDILSFGSDNDIFRF